MDFLLHIICNTFLETISAAIILPIIVVGIALCIPGDIHASC